MIGERPPSADNWYGWWYAGHGQAGSGSPDMLLGVAEVNDGARYAEDCGSGPFRFSNGNPDRQCDLFHFWSLHSAGANFATAGGSVHFLSYSTDENLMRALATRNGREIASIE